MKAIEIYEAIDSLYQKLKKSRLVLDISILIISLISAKALVADSEIVLPESNKFGIAMYTTAGILFLLATVMRLIVSAVMSAAGCFFRGKETKQKKTK